MILPRHLQWAPLRHYHSVPTIRMLTRWTVGNELWTAWAWGGAVTNLSSTDQEFTELDHSLDKAADDALEGHRGAVVLPTGC